MLEKSCGWWPIWYLLFFCHGGAEGQLQWDVKEKVTDYGQNVTLFCPVENCCSEVARWSVGQESIFIDLKKYSNDSSKKYGGTYNKDGFGVVIRNLSEADLNVTHRCDYGFIRSTPKYLLHDDVFTESTDVPDKDEEYNTVADNTVTENNTVADNNTVAIVISIVVAIVVIVVGAIIIVYIIKKKRQTRRGRKKKRRNSKGTGEERKSLIDLSYLTENQEDAPSNQKDVPLMGVISSSTNDILTRATEGVNGLEKNKIILLTGIDGIGKTFTAEKIVELYLKKHSEFKLLDLSRLRRLQKKPYKKYFLSERFQPDNGKLIVYMDDFLANQHVNYLKEDLDILKMVDRTKCDCPGTVEVVLTVDNSRTAWCKEELEQCGLLSEVYLIDLNKEFNKTEALQEFLKVYLPGKEDHLYMDIVEKYKTAKEPKIGFPELCYLSSKNKIFRNQDADFFQDPSKSLDEYFMKLASEEENVFYIALVQIMMTSKLVVVDIPKAEIKNMQNMFNILYNKTLDVQSLERIIDKTNGGILIKTSENRDGMYVFQNPLILNFLFNSFNRIISPLGLEKVLGFFTLEFIVDFVRTHLNITHQSIHPNTVNVMVVEEESYPLLAVRISEIIFENGMESVYRLCLSPLLDDKIFLHILLEECGKHTERRSSDSFGYFPAALLESVMKYRPSTEIVKIVLDYMLTTLEPQSPSTVVILCYRSVKLAKKKAGIGDCEIFGQFITKHKFYYSDS